MKDSARKRLTLLAVFLLLTGSGLTAGSSEARTGRYPDSRLRPASSSSADAGYFNPLAIPELQPPPEKAGNSVQISTKPSNT